MIFKNFTIYNKNKMNKWKVGLICGVVWGMVSFYFWMMLAGGPSSSTNPPVIFLILTLPASIPLLVSYYIEDVVDFSGSLVICLIPITGALIGIGIGYLIDRFKEVKAKIIIKIRWTSQFLT